MIPFEQIKYNNNHFVHNRFERFFTGVTFLCQIIDKWRQFSNYTLTLVVISPHWPLNISFSTNKENLFGNQELGDHFLYSHDPYILFKGDTLRRNYKSVS